jgi:MFS family permease
MGISAALIAVGQIAGPMVAGVLADLTGDYRLGFTALAVTAALGSVSFMMAVKPAYPAARI